MAIPQPPSGGSLVFPAVPLAPRGCWRRRSTRGGATDEPPAGWERRGPRGCGGHAAGRSLASPSTAKTGMGGRVPAAVQGREHRRIERYVVRVARDRAGARAVLGQVAKRRLFAVLEGQGFVRVGESVVERRGCGRRVASVCTLLAGDGGGDRRSAPRARTVSAAALIRAAVRRPARANGRRAVEAERGGDRQGRAAPELRWEARKLERG